MHSYLSSVGDRLWETVTQFLGFPAGSDGKASACHAGDPGLSPGSGRSLGEGNGYQFQYSPLGYNTCIMDSQRVGHD